MTSHPSPGSELPRDIKDLFAVWATVCTKCGHLAEEHYWSGGGNPACSGYDRCKHGECKCVDYDESKDFVDKVIRYDEDAIKIVQKAIHTAQEQAVEEEREQIRSKIGQLRQWINEKPSNFLATNAAIEGWLDLTPLPL